MPSEPCRRYLQHIDHADMVREVSVAHDLDEPDDAHDTGADSEPVDVVRIRLSMPTNATALLSEYRSADKVLAQWACQCERDMDVDTVDYEITFFDGYVMRGCYSFFRRGKLKRSFSSHIRALMRQDPPARGRVRYLAPA
jgi:hypothetical protein